MSELQFNSQFKSLLGWMPDENIQTVNGNYSGRIYASDQTKASDRKYALKIDANRTLGTGNDEMSNMDYWIEHRSRFTSDAVINNGAMIYLADEVGTRNHLALLDMTPNTETYNETSHVNQAHDQALQNGGSFTDSNNRWKIQITGKGGSGADAYVDVQVTDLLSPQITGQPVADQNATAGGSVTFNVTASGSSLTYQWQKQDANGTWVNINGANAASLTLSNLTTGNAGKYRVAITNNYGTVYSGESVLNVSKAIPIIPHSVAYYPFNGNANDESGNAGATHGLTNGATLSKADGNPTNRRQTITPLTMRKTDHTTFNTGAFSISVGLQRLQPIWQWC